MFPHNESLEQVFWGILNYASGRWYAMCIFALLFLWAWYLYKEFHWRATKYNENTPKECMLLNLQCRRWERCVHQVIVGIRLSVGLAFIMYLVVAMGKDIALVAQTKGNNMLQNLNIAYAEAIVFVFLFEVDPKSRTIFS